MYRKFCLEMYPLHWNKKMLCKIRKMHPLTIICVLDKLWLKLYCSTENVVLLQTKTMYASHCAAFLIPVHVGSHLAVGSSSEFSSCPQICVPWLNEQTRRVSMAGWNQDELCRLVCTKTTMGTKGHHGWFPWLWFHRLQQTTTDCWRGQFVHWVLCKWCIWFNELGEDTVWLSIVPLRTDLWKTCSW